MKNKKKKIASDTARLLSEQYCVMCELVVWSLQANRSLCCVQMFCANAQCTIILDPTF